MTPKEKAQELILNFYDVKPENIDYGMEYQMAKQCALIAVDEILDDDVYDMSEELFEKRINYWQEVKKEIEKL